MNEMLILHSYQLASLVPLGTVQYGPAKIWCVNTYQPYHTEPSLSCQNNKAAHTGTVWFTHLPLI